MTYLITKFYLGTRERTEVLVGCSIGITRVRTKVNQIKILLLLHYNLITSGEEGKFSRGQGEWWQIGEEKHDCRQSVELQINEII